VIAVTSTVGLAVTPASTAPNSAGLPSVLGWWSDVIRSTTVTNY